MGGLVGTEGDPQTAVVAARAELRVTLAKLAVTNRPLSRFRRLMLLYAPRGWRAWLAHSLFYALCVFCGGFAVAAYLADLDLGPAETIRFVLAMSLFGLLFERWAALEYRASNAVILKARPVGPVFYGVTLSSGMIVMGDETRSSLQLIAPSYGGPRLMVRDENGYSTTVGRTALTDTQDGTQSHTSAACIVASSKDSTLRYSLMKAGVTPK